MAAKPLAQSIVDDVMADYRTGAYSYSQLADRHGISKAKVGLICKGVDPDLTSIVDAGIRYRSGLADKDRRIVDAVSTVVDDRVRHIEFFNKAAIKNVEAAFAVPVENQQDVRHRAATIKDAKEVVLGKTPDTAVQVNVDTHSRIERVIV